MSYRKKHVKNKIQRIKPRQSILKKLWFWIIILCLLAILSIFYGILFYPDLQLNSVLISGNDRIKTQDIQELVWSNSNTGLINFRNVNLASRSLLLINQETINKKILEKFPAIERVVINKKFPQTLVLGIVERKPIGVFCPAETKGPANSRCFLIDSNGIAFEPLSINQKDLTIVRQMAENGQIFTGEEVVAQNMMNAISKIQNNLRENFNLNLEEALITTPLRLNIKTGEGWKIYFDLEQNSDVDLQIMKLNLLLGGELSLENRGNLRYVDLRPKDRAIVCNNSTCGGR